jgi:hypothetical protein
MKNPTSVWLSYLSVVYGHKLKGRAPFDYGRVAMALEIVSKIKLLESLPVTTEYGRQEAISALHTILVETGLAESVYDLYEQLNDWRRPKFAPSQQPEPSPSATAGADGPWPQRRYVSLFSAAEEPESEQPPLGSTDEWPLGRRSPREDSSPTDE